jgi:hypothetical protein
MPQHGGKTWTAQIGRSDRTIYIAAFPTERDAAVARDRVALSLLGRSGPLNFPRGRLTPASVDEMRRWARQLRKHGAAQTSALLGVSYDDRRPDRNWVAALWIGSRTVNLGYWSTEVEAAEAHDRAILHYRRGVRYRLNFPRRLSSKPADASTLRAEAFRRHKQATSSRYVGVTWSKRKERWLARLLANGELHNIGYFQQEEEAAWRRDQLALELLGNRARLNFHPETGDEVHGQRLEALVARRRHG